ncbi:MAG: elongation factor 4, partial [Chloroflexota bacterium]|nr:elongation factor 4 [Chloroflexota bacterium]
VVLPDGTVEELDNPSKLPEPHLIAEVREPWLDLTVVTPSRFIGAVMELMSSHRAEFKKMEYVQGGAVLPQGRTQQDGQPGAEARVVMEYQMPLSEMLADLYNDLKSCTQGYASLDYTLAGYRAGPLVKLEVLINQLPVDALSIIIHRDRAYPYARALLERLRTLIPRQQFEVPLQAAINGRIIARETIRPMRKDVLAKCYGGDVSRKRKLLEAQKEGKKRLKRIGRVEIPQEAFLALLKADR